MQISEICTALNDLLNNQLSFTLQASELSFTVSELITSLSTIFTAVTLSSSLSLYSLYRVSSSAVSAFLFNLSLIYYLSYIIVTVSDL